MRKYKSVLNFKKTLPPEPKKTINIITNQQKPTNTKFLSITFLSLCPNPYENSNVQTETLILCKTSKEGQNRTSYSKSVQLKIFQSILPPYRGAKNSIFASL